MFKARLVELANRDRAQFKPVFGEGRAGERRDLFRKERAVVVYVLHTHACRHRTHGTEKLAFKKRGQLIGIADDVAQGGRRRRDGGWILGHAQEELRPGIHAHPVLCDEGGVLFGPNLQPREAEIDRRHLVDDRKRERAAGDDDLLAAEPGAYESAVACRAMIEPVEQPNHDQNRDQQNNQGRDDRTGHGSTPLDRLEQAGLLGQRGLGRQSFH